MLHLTLRWAAALMLLALVAGCMSQPALDTANKRAYATELAIEGMLDQIDQYEREGRFTDEEWAEITGHLERLRMVRQAMQNDLSLGRDPGANIATIHSILTLLRPYVAEGG